MVKIQERERDNSSKKDILERFSIYRWGKEIRQRGREREENWPALITLPVDLITKEGRGVIGMPTFHPQTTPSCRLLRFVSRPGPYCIFIDGLICGSLVEPTGGTWYWINFPFYLYRNVISLQRYRRCEFLSNPI